MTPGAGRRERRKFLSIFSGFFLVQGQKASPSWKSSCSRANAEISRLTIDFPQTFVAQKRLLSSFRGIFGRAQLTAKQIKGRKSIVIA
jgi:hypothetical protein